MRRHLPFRAVNRPDRTDYDPGLQRHHLLPRQLLVNPALERMFTAIGVEQNRFEDFRENGLLLPCDEPAAIRVGLPLHRGPHRRYSALVMERVGQIEAAWTTQRRIDPQAAMVQAQMRLGLLQKALRRFLLEGTRRRLLLNRHDPLGAGTDFSELDTMADAMADTIWGAMAISGAGLPKGLTGATGEVQPMPMRSRKAALAD